MVWVGGENVACEGKEDGRGAIRAIFDHLQAERGVMEGPCCADRGGAGMPRRVVCGLGTVSPQHRQNIR